MLVVFVLSVFCIAPFEMDYRWSSALIYACDRDGMILLCPILAIALLAVQYLNEKLQIREVLTYVFLGGAVTTFVGAVASEYGGKSFEAVMFETGGGIPLLSVGFAGLAAAVLLRKGSYRNVSRSATAFLALTAMLSFLWVPFVRVGYGLNGHACFRFFKHDALWAYAFVIVPLLVAALQCLRNAQVRFCATFALWIPFLLFFGSEVWDEQLKLDDLTFEASLYACIALLTSVAAYCSMRYDDAERVGRVSDGTGAIAAAKRSDAAPFGTVNGPENVAAAKRSDAAVLITAAIMVLAGLGLGGIWVNILFAAVPVGCLIANRNNLQPVSLAGLGLSTFAWLSAVGVRIGWIQASAASDDNGLAQLLSVLEYALLALHLAGPLLYIWTTNASRRVKILYSLLPVFMLAGALITKIVWSRVFGADMDAEAGQLSIESRIAAAQSYISSCSYALFAFGAAVWGLLWRMLRPERKR